MPNVQISGFRGHIWTWRVNTRQVVRHGELTIVIRFVEGDRQSSINLLEKPSSELGVTRSPQLLEHIKSTQCLGFCFSKHILSIPQPSLQ